MSILEEADSRFIAIIGTAEGNPPSSKPAPLLQMRGAGDLPGRELENKAKLEMKISPGTGTNR